jgi:hypothetical protein
VPVLSQKSERSFQCMFKEGMVGFVSF